MKKIMIILLLVHISFSIFSAENLTISFLMLNGKHRVALREVVNEFKKENNEIEVKFIEKNNEDYHTWFNTWQKEDVDVVWWFAGYQLNQLAKQGDIYNLKDLWNKNDLDKAFASSKSSVSDSEDNIYGLPLSYYQWGFYYNKNLFKKLGIEEPKTWEDFLKVCEKLKEKNITPLGIGTKNNWPGASWFSYLDLRINGLDFHRKLLNGEISYEDKRVRRVFEELKSLINKEYFFAEHATHSWKEILPYLYRSRVGFYLIGNFMVSSLSISENEIGFFKFPIIDKNIDLYEEAPTDVLFVSNYSKNKKSAEKFIEFMSRPEIQRKYNESIKFISPNKNSLPSDNVLTQSGAKILNEANGFSQYFDRDTSKEMAGIGFEILGDFFRNPNIDETIQRLEESRKKYLLEK